MPPKCMPEVRIQRAGNLQAQATDSVRRGLFKDAAKLFGDALEALGYSYRTDILDDSNLKLALAREDEKRGEYRAAATIRKSILSDRLRVSRPETSPECTSKAP